MHINGTKKRIKDELEKLGGFVWITEGKEVENYIPIDVYASLSGQPAPTVGSYDDIVNHPLLAGFKQDKIKLAHAVAEVMTSKNIEGVLDLGDQLEQLIMQIKIWNSV